MKKLNNKGFSLVELIIVIAIMAILVGVVGTQVIPYLENSRQGKDLQVFSSWNTAGMSAYSMNADQNITDPTITITVDVQNGTVSCDNDKIKATFESLTGLADSGNDIKGSLASKAGKAVTTVVVKINVTAETVATEINGGDGKFNDIENK